MRITYEADEEGDLILGMDNEDITGTFVKVGLGDDRGLEILLRLAEFYEGKGHNVQRILGNFFRQKAAEEGIQARPKRGWWARLFGGK